MALSGTLTNIVHQLEEQVQDMLLSNSKLLAKMENLQEQLHALMVPEGEFKRTPFRYNGRFNLIDRDAQLQRLSDSIQGKAVTTREFIEAVQATCPNDDYATKALNSAKECSNPAAAILHLKHHEQAEADKETKVKSIALLKSLRPSTTQVQVKATLDHLIRNLGNIYALHVLELNQYLGEYSFSGLPRLVSAMNKLVEENEPISRKAFLKQILSIHKHYVDIPVISLKAVHFPILAKRDKCDSKALFLESGEEILQLSFAPKPSQNSSTQEIGKGESTPIYDTDFEFIDESEYADI